MTMDTKDRNRHRMNQILHDFILEASEEELRDAITDANEDFDELANRGWEATQRALSNTLDSAEVEGLHRCLGVLLQMLRRRDHLSVDALAEEARVSSSELRSIERDPTFDPNPRTIYQLARYFKLPEKSLVVLSGAVQVSNDVREEAERFAASSENISELTKEQRKLLHHFVKFLREQTD